MNWMPDPETLYRLRQFSHQQVREYMAEQRKKEAEIESPASIESNSPRARKPAVKSASRTKNSRTQAVPKKSVVTRSTTSRNARVGLTVVK